MFDTARLLAILNSLLPECRRYLVGFSGGMDSTVLLHTLASLRPRLDVELTAMHVHHGLHPRADAWQRFCEDFCSRYGVVLISRRVAVTDHQGEGPEAAARRARYQAFADIARHGDCLLTAHHRDDQVETLLLHLLRGSGPHGLAAMAPCRPWHGIWHARPLLDFPREVLRAYALAHDLDWVEDPTNAARDFDRNYLRHEILPRLEARWRGCPSTLARAARHQRTAAGLLEDLARLDRAGAAGGRPDTLSVSALSRLPRPRRANLIREWIRCMGLPGPPSRRLDQILGRVLGARRDAMPLVCWPGVEIRRYRDELFAMSPLSEHDPSVVYPWDPKRPLTIPGLGLQVSLEGLKALGLDPGRLTPPVRVGFRQGGERCLIPGRRHHRPLKALFQEAGIPPWERSRIPLVYVQGRLVAVVGLWACECGQG